MRLRAPISVKPHQHARVRQNALLGKKSPTLTGAVFVLAAQLIDSHQENPLVYGGCTSWGIYTQADPIGLEGGLNRFGYVGGNALGFSDPLGLQAQAAAVVCGPFAFGCAAVITGAIAMSTPQGQQIVKDLTNKIVDLCKPGDDDPCDIVLDKGQLKSAGIRGREHEVKEDALGSNKNLSKFDLCGCKNGRVVVKFHGCRGPVIEVTDYKWK